MAQCLRGFKSRLSHYKMIRTGPTNKDLRILVSELKKKKIPLFDRISKELDRPTRQRRVVNLSRIDNNIRKDEIAVVPGKVLGCGKLTKKITIAAWQFSKEARDKIKAAGGEAITLKELEKKKGAKRIIG